MRVSASSSLDSGHKRLLGAHKEVDFALHPVVALVLQVGGTEKFPQALGFKSLDPCLRVSKRGHVSKDRKECR